MFETGISYAQAQASNEWKIPLYLKMRDVRIFNQWYWHMIFCKFDQSISIFPYEKAVGHRLIVASALKELTNIAAMLDFALISTFYLKNWWWKYILDSIALKKKFQQHDDYGMYVIFWGGGDPSHNGRHLGFVEIRKGMISFLILLMSFLCRGTV